MGWIKVAETLLNPFGDDDEVSDSKIIIPHHVNQEWEQVECNKCYDW